MLNHVEHLAQAGFALHRLHPKSKRPIGDDWSSKPVLTASQLSAAYRPGENIGVRLGRWSNVLGLYLHVIDMDIRTDRLAAEAEQWIAENFPEAKFWPTVISGSGGRSRHFYLLSDRPFPSKKLAHSKEKVLGDDGKRHWAWEIELFGTGKQVVLPPSIHPDTGRPYAWLNEFDFPALEEGVGPIVRSERIAKLIGEEATGEGYEGERAAPLGLTQAEILDILTDLPTDEWREDRDGWLRVGMALHHETGGSDEGYKLWLAFSKGSDKHDPKDQKRVWKSFKGNPRPTRMSTLVAAAREARIEREFVNLDDAENDIEFDDLGDDPTPAATKPERSTADIFADLFGDDDESEPAKPAPVSKRQEKLNKAKIEADLGHVPPKVARINRKHAVAFINGKTVILTETSDGGVSYGTVGDLHAWYENDRVATDKSTVPITKQWLQHKKRREYPQGVVFAPGETVDGAYNHWRGFAYDPNPNASCKHILAHIQNVICRSDETSFRYLIGWLAHMIQRPGEKPGVAVVLRGAKGTGKDTLGDFMGKLFPHHHVVVASQEHMVGRFNAHQERCLMLHLQEGFWAGSKQAEGQLKYLITSERVFIEPKGLNGFHVKSVLRLFMSSNEKWVVPATEDERRYFVQDVSDRYSVKNATPAERKAYFDPIRAELNGDGPAALLYFLQNVDLSEFDIRDVPNTAALAEQKVQGLKNIERWWFGILQSGQAPFEIASEKGVRLADWSQSPISVSKDEFRHAYAEWMRHRRFDGEELRDFEIGKHLKNLMPTVEQHRTRGENGKRVLRYVFPSLQDCRRTFEKWLGSQIFWEDIDTVIDEPEFDDLDA